MTAPSAVVGDDERAARATLLRISEPAVAHLVAHVRAVGPVAAVADVRRGAALERVDVAALQHRLAGVDGRRDLDVGHRAGARLVCPGDDEWPPSLDDLAWVDADCFGLWVVGDERLDVLVERAVAIVGTRAATSYGVLVADELASGLADRGWTVVSGLAFGVDAAAHRGALAASGPTVAALACGVDVPYPKAHRTLYERVRASGAVVSEHPPGAAPQRTRFLARNRLLAAMSRGTVVVEAASRSGALSTARHAAALNRHLMVVPGPVTAATSIGCHQLLRDRPDAVVVTRVEEVVEQVGSMGEIAPRMRGPEHARDALGPTVRRVYEAVPFARDATLAQVARTAGQSVETTDAALVGLARLGLVAPLGDGRWRMTTEGRRDRRGLREGATFPMLFD